MKIGYVGVGNWATQLKEAFERRGHEAAWHVRSATSPAPGFGARLDNLDNADSVDLVVCAAPPDVVHSWACTFPQIPMLVTKPFDESRLSRPREAPTYVDLWRVLTPEWEEFRSRWDRETLSIFFGGEGPYRPYLSGSMDYGPHAMAYAVDLEPRDLTSQQWTLTSRGDSCMINIRHLLEFGNRMQSTHIVRNYNGSLEMRSPSKPAGLDKLVEHCETGNTYTYELNKRVMHELRNVPWTVK